MLQYTLLFVFLSECEYDRNLPGGSGIQFNRMFLLFINADAFLLEDFLALVSLSEVKLPYDPSCPSVVGWLVGLCRKIHILSHIGALIVYL